MGDQHETVRKIDRYVQSLCNLGMDLAKETELEQGCEPGSCFEFLAPNVCTNHLASNYYEQKIKFCSSNKLIHVDSTNASDFQLRKRIRHFVASKADLVFKLKGKEKLRGGIDYNAEGSNEAYSLFATQTPPLEFGMKISHCVRRAQIFQILKVDDIIAGNVVGKRPFGVFVRITSLIHGRNLDFNDIDIQALCHKSELASDHKSREHFDPIDDFEVNDIVRGVICSVSVEEERIAISFRSSKLPSEYRNIELGIVEDTEEQNCRAQSFDENREYNDYLENDPGFANPTNIQTLIDVLGINTKPVNSLLRSCQQWSFDNQGDAASLRKQQSIKWSMDTTAVGVENFKSGSHEKAIKCFNHALQIYQDNAEALVARGALYANQNKLENAIKDFRQALKVHPKHHNACKYLRETLFEKAVRLKKIGNFREAIEIFKEVINLDPSNRESQDHVQELQAVMAKQCAEEESSKQRTVSVGSVKESHQFEHVRKLIKADPDLVRSSRKKKRKKKKKRKEVKRKKRTHHKKVSSDSTSTASEDGDDSGGDEWIEKRSLRKPSPTSREKYEEKLARSHDGQELKDEIKSGHSISTNPGNEDYDVQGKRRVVKTYSRERSQSSEIETEGATSVENYRRSESNERSRKRQNEDRNSSRDREHKLEEWSSLDERSYEASRQKERTSGFNKRSGRQSPGSLSASLSRSRSKSQQRRNEIGSKDTRRTLSRSSSSSGSQRNRTRGVRRGRNRSITGRSRSTSERSRSGSGRSRSDGRRGGESRSGRRSGSRSTSGERVRNRRRERIGSGSGGSSSGRRGRSTIGRNSSGSKRRGRSRSQRGGSRRRGRSRSRSTSGKRVRSRSGRREGIRSGSRSGRRGRSRSRSTSGKRVRSRSRSGRRERIRSGSRSGRSGRRGRSRSRSER